MLHRQVCNMLIYSWTCTRNLKNDEDHLFTRKQYCTTYSGQAHHNQYSLHVVCRPSAGNVAVAQLVLPHQTRQECWPTCPLVCVTCRVICRCQPPPPTICFPAAEKVTSWHGYAGSCTSVALSIVIRYGHLHVYDGFLVRQKLGALLLPI